MANPGKMHQEMQQRQLDAKDSNISTIRWCVLTLVLDALLWTNPWFSWHGLVDITAFLSAGHWAQGGAIFWYGVGVVGIGIPFFQIWNATKQLSAASTKPGS